MSNTTKKEISRREFLKESGLAAGGAALATLTLSAGCNSAGTDTSATGSNTAATTASRTSPAASTTTGTGIAPGTTTSGSSTPPPSGQYTTPAGYPGLMDTYGCTSKVATDRLYSVDHVWVKSIGGDEVVLGVSDKFVLLSDTVTELDILKKPGETLTRGESFASVEAYKLNTDLITPVSGKVLQINLSLQAIPGQINSYPYTQGWITVVQLSNPKELDDANVLVSPAYYAYLQAKEVPPSVPPKR